MREKINLAEIPRDRIVNDLKIFLKGAMNIGYTDYTLDKIIRSDKEIKFILNNRFGNIKLTLDYYQVRKYLKFRKEVLLPFYKELSLDI